MREAWWAQIGFGNNTVSNFWQDFRAVQYKRYTKNSEYFPLSFINVTYSKSNLSDLQSFLSLKSIKYFRIKFNMTFTCDFCKTMFIALYQNFHPVEP